MKCDIVKAKPADHVGKNRPQRTVPVNVECNGRAALLQKAGCLKQNLEPLLRHKPAGGNHADRTARGGLSGCWLVDWKAMGNDMDLRVAFALRAKHVPRPGLGGARQEDGIVGRRQMSQLAGMADQADRLSRTACQRGQIGIVDEDKIGSTDGGTKAAMEKGACQQMRPDHRRRHGDQTDAGHPGQPVHRGRAGWQNHNMLMAALRKGRRIGAKRGGNAPVLPVGGDGQNCRHGCGLRLISFPDGACWHGIVIPPRRRLWRNR